MSGLWKKSTPNPKQGKLRSQGGIFSVSNPPDKKPFPRKEALPWAGYKSAGHKRRAEAREAAKQKAKEKFTLLPGPKQTGKLKPKTVKDTNPKGRKPKKKGFWS